MFTPRSPFSPFLLVPASPDSAFLVRGTREWHRRLTNSGKEVTAAQQQQATHTRGQKAAFGQKGKMERRDGESATSSFLRLLRCCCCCRCCVGLTFPSLTHEAVFVSVVSRPRHLLSLPHTPTIPSCTSERATHTSAHTNLIE